MNSTPQKSGGDTSLARVRKEKQRSVTALGAEKIIFERVIIQKDTTAEWGGSRASGSLAQPHHGQCLINLINLINSLPVGQVESQSRGGRKLHL